MGYKMSKPAAKTTAELCSLNNSFSAADASHLLEALRMNSKATIDNAFFTGARVPVLLSHLVIAPF